MSDRGRISPGAHTVDRPATRLPDDPRIVVEPDDEPTATPAFGGRAVGLLLGTLAVGNLVQGLWIKDFPKLNLTLISLGLLALAAVHLRRGERKRALGAPLLLLLAFAPGFLQPIMNPGAETKRLGILGVVFGCLVLGFLTSGRRRVAPTMLVAMQVGAVLVLLALWFRPDTMSMLSGRRTPIGVNAIGAGRVMAVGSVVSLWYALRAGALAQRMAWLVLAAVMLGGVVVTGSRGPAAGALFGALTLMLTHAGLPKITRVAMMGLTVASLAYAFGELSSSGARITSGTDTGRGLLLHHSIAVGWSHKLGIGWGNLYSYLPNHLIDNEQGYNQYPHNLFVEMFVEGGIAALVLLLVPLYIVVVRARRSTLPEMPVLLALFAGALVGAMVSSDVVGNQLLWVLAGVILGHTSWKSRRAESTGRPGAITPLRGTGHRPDARPRTKPGRPTGPASSRH